MEGLKGIYTATITPFDVENKINDNALCQIMDKNINEGASGFFIGGSSGECFLLSFQERKRLLDIAGSYKNKTNLIAHIGSISTEEAISLGKHAKSLGYHALSSVAPYYFKLPLKNIVQYFIDIVEAVDLPMIVYNFPNATGVHLDTTDQDVIKLLKHPKIVGMKHTNLDLYQFERIKNIDESLIVYNGYDEIFLGGLAMGVDGAIGSTFNFLLPKFIQIHNLYQQKELDQARRIQKQVNRIMDVLIEVGLISGIKYALELQGIEAGEARRPFAPLEDSQKKHLERVIYDNL